MPTQQEKCESFRQLHAGPDTFIIPNPWDLGSAKVMEAMGFAALATTSAGFAYSLGRQDGKVSLEEKLAHCRLLAENTSIPINADFENGFADDPETVAKNVSRLIESGVSGGSIEDFSRDGHTLYDATLATERVAAAAAAVKSSGLPFQLTGRAENLLRGVSDLDDTIRRLQAYSKAGADVLYAPGISNLADLKTVIEAVDKPVNVLGAFFRGTSVAEFHETGVKRISLGAALTWASIAPLVNAGQEMLESGTFNWMAAMPDMKAVQKMLD